MFQFKLKSMKTDYRNDHVKHSFGYELSNVNYNKNHRSLNEKTKHLEKP